MKIKTGSLIWEISFPLAAVMTAVILYDSSLSVTVCFLSVIIHESGHLAVMRLFGIRPERIRLRLFDFAIIDRSKTLLSFAQELAVISAGVTANLLTAGICLFIPGDTASKLVSADLTLALFNALPIGSLDGGQALSLILCRYLNIEKALLAADIISVLTLIPLTAFGFLVLMKTGYNFSVLLAAIYLAAQIIIKDCKKRGK